MEVSKLITFLVEHILHAVLVLLVWLLCHSHQRVYLVAVLYVPFIDGIKIMVDLLCNPGFLLDNLKLGDHLLDCLLRLLIILESILVELLINVCRYLAVHRPLKLKLKIHSTNWAGTISCSSHRWSLTRTFLFSFRAQSLFTWLFWAFSCRFITDGRVCSHPRLSKAILGGFGSRFYSKSEGSSR